MHTLDIFTRDIIQNSLQAIADEMFAAMRKAAMSPVIYEVLDMGTGITDANGEIASSGAGIPAFVGVLDKAVKQILLQHSGPDDIQDGDVFICNDPHSGAVTHLNDVVLAMPVFAEGAVWPGPPTLRTGTMSAAWCLGHCRPRPPISSRKVYACARSS